MSKIKWIIGVDCALRNTGVVVFDNMGKLQANLNIKTPNGAPDHVSVDLIVERFFDALQPYLDKPEGTSITRLYFENIFFGKTGKANARSEANGCLKWNLRQDSHQIFGVEPNALNSFLAGRLNFKYTSRKSKEIKQQTMQMLHRHCGFYTRDDNIADAYVAALYGYAHTIEKQRLSPSALSRLV